MKEIISDLKKIFPIHFLEDFACQDIDTAGPHYEVIEDHLSTVCMLSPSEISELRESMFILKVTNKL